jgi:hypothetical protein
MGQVCVGSAVRYFINDRSSRLNPAACTTTVTATIVQAIKITAIMGKSQPP